MPRLVPLRVPGGWMVVHNTFADEEPIIRDGVVLNDEYYGEDLLSVERLRWTGAGYIMDPDGHTLDLGWLPAADPEGAYELTLLHGGWDRVVFVFRSRDRQAIRAAADQALQLATQGVPDAEIARLVTTGEAGAPG